MQPVIIRRSKNLILIFVIGYGLMLLLGALNEAGVIEVKGISHWLFRLFLAGFILPAFLYFCGLWFQRRKPIIMIGETDLEFREGPFLETVLRIQKAGVLGVRTNWKGPNSDSAGDLIFALDAEASSMAELSSVLRKRKDGWYFPIASAEVTPFEAIEIIRRSTVSAHIEESEATE